MTVRVVADDTGRTLVVGGLAASHVDAADPSRLEFGYMRRVAAVLDVCAPAGRPLRVLHLGAGLGALARYVAATRPGSHNRLVELDPAIAQLARADGLDVHTGDAREAIESAPRRSADVVVGDVFDGPRVPRHLTTREYAQRVRRALAPGGVYVVNLIDDPPHRLARRQVATLCATFAECVLLAERAVLTGRRTGNLVVACADRTLPAAKLARRSPDVLDAEATRLWCDGAKPVRD
jgi:spermidine synthase